MKQSWAAKSIGEPFLRSSRRGKGISRIFADGANRKEEEETAGAGAGRKRKPKRLTLIPRLCQSIRDSCLVVPSFLYIRPAGRPSTSAAAAAGNYAKRVPAGPLSGPRSPVVARGASLSANEPARTRRRSGRQRDDAAVCNAQVLNLNAVGAPLI